MIDEKKIITMTKLAVIEKHMIQEDLKITSYYEEDYVYANNFRTRVSVLILLGLAIVAHLLWRIENGLNIPLTQQEIFEVYIIPYGMLMVVGIVLATVVSSLIYKEKYIRAANNVSKYRKQLQELGAIHGLEEDRIKEAKHYGNGRRDFTLETKDSTVL